MQRRTAAESLCATVGSAAPTTPVNTRTFSGSSAPHASSAHSLRRRVARTAAAMAAVTLAAACGGSGSSTPPTTKTVTTSSAAAGSSSTGSSSTGSPSTGSPSSAAAPSTTKSSAATTTAASDESQIRVAFIAFFDGATPGIDKKVALLENGEKYRQMLVDAGANAQFQKLTANVRSVQMTPDSGCAALGVASPCASVTFDLLVGGFPALAAHQSPAAKIGGVWKVAAKAWCDVVAIGGDQCPS